MKVLYHHRTQANDGQAVHIRALQRGLRETGHEVREVGLVQQDGGDGGASADEGRSRWGWVTKLPRFLLELAEYGYSGMARRNIVGAARDFRPDFLYERYAFGNLGGAMAARSLDLPLVLEVNSPLVDELIRTRGLSFSKLAHRVERAIFRGATRICVVTRVLGDLLVELGAPADRILVTPNGVHPADFAAVAVCMASCWASFSSPRPRCRMARSTWSSAHSGDEPARPSCWMASSRLSTSSGLRRSPLSIWSLMASQSGSMASSSTSDSRKWRARVAAGTGASDSRSHTAMARL